MAMPTAAKVTAAARNRIVEMLRDGASSSRVTSISVVGAGAGGSTNVESADEKPSGISNSEDGYSSFVGAAAFRLGRLRCL
jgi:hypothetical protein